jgi:hypothetical protein
MAGGCAFGSWINSHFLLHFSSFFFAVVFLLFEAQVFLTALRPGPVEIWVEARNSARNSSDSGRSVSLPVAPGT